VDLCTPQLESAPARLDTLASLPIRRSREEKRRSAVANHLDSCARGPAGRWTFRWRRIPGVIDEMIASSRTPTRVRARLMRASIQSLLRRCAHESGNGRGSCTGECKHAYRIWAYLVSCYPVVPANDVIVLNSASRGLGCRSRSSAVSSDAPRRPPSRSISLPSISVIVLISQVEEHLRAKLRTHCSPRSRILVSSAGRPFSPASISFLAASFSPNDPSILHSASHSLSLSLSLGNFYDARLDRSRREFLARLLD